MLIARFLKEPRFTRIDGVIYPVLFEDCLSKGYYEESFEKFSDEFCSEFFDIVRERREAVIVRVMDDGWHPFALHSIIAPSFGDYFCCNVGERKAAVREG